MTSLSRSCATSRLEPWTDTHTHRTTTVTLAHARRGLNISDVYDGKGYRKYADFLSKPASISLYRRRCTV